MTGDGLALDRAAGTGRADFRQAETRLPEAGNRLEGGQGQESPRNTWA